jgi:nitrogen fixation-related uncharacterized protein
VGNAVSIITLVAGIVGLGIILWAVKTGEADRYSEDDARAFLEEHGHWPDQTAEEAEAIRAAFRRATPMPVSEPDERGRV